MDMPNLEQQCYFKKIVNDLTCAENEIRTNAEKFYNDLSGKDKIILLVTLLHDNEATTDVAEMGAILLRRLIINEYSSFCDLSFETQTQIKEHILSRMLSDINQNLRKKISEIASEIARKNIDDAGNNSWPECLKFLFDSARSADSSIREVSLLFFAEIPNIFGSEQHKYLCVIHEMLLQNLSESNVHQVRQAAVKATCEFLIANEKQPNVIKPFHDCMNPILQFLDNILATEEGDTSVVLQSLLDLVETCPQAVRGNIDNIFTLCMRIMTIENESYQQLSLEVIVTLCESAPAMVRKLGSKHMHNLISLVLKMMAMVEEDEEWENSEEENDDVDSDSIPFVAEGAIDRIACALGGKAILPVIIDLLPQMFTSVIWKDRHAALLALGAIGEGCHKEMSLLLPQILDGILPFLKDQHFRVRYAAVNSIGQMSSDFSPIFQKKFHSKVLPALLELQADSSSSRVQAHAGAALCNFFEPCPKNILTPYISTIVSNFELVFRSKLDELIKKRTKFVLEQVVVSLAALADVIEKDFSDYYEKFMPYLKYIIENATEAQFALLRGKAIECVSLIGLAVGKEKFLSDASAFMELLLKTLSPETPLADDDPQLSYMIAAWARMCKILGKDFEPYLPLVIQSVLKTASIKPEIAVMDASDSSIQHSDDWKFLDVEDKSIGIKTAGLEDKATACEMLVCYASELKSGFAQYVEETVKLMVPLLQFYFHDGVRSSAAEIMPYLLESAKIHGKEYILEMWKFILPALLQALETEPEYDVLCDHIGSLSHCIMTLGFPCIAHENMINLINILNKKLTEHSERFDIRKKARSSEDYDDIMEEALNNESDEENYILGKISYLVSSLFTVFKHDFFNYFEMLLASFVHLLNPTRPVNDRQWAICIFADIIEHGGPICAKYQYHFLQPTLAAINDEDADMRQTAAYTIGNLGQYGGPEFANICAESVPLLMQAINIPNSRSEENERATENAISAITKFLIYNNSRISMEKILPVWMMWLPAWEDEEEVDCIYNFLCSLLEGNNPTLLGNDNCNLPHIVKIIAQTFQKEGIKPATDLGKRILTLIRDIQNNPVLFEKCIDYLEPELKNVLHTALVSVFGEVTS